MARGIYGLGLRAAELESRQSFLAGGLVGPVLQVGLLVVRRRVWGEKETGEAAQVLAAAAWSCRRSHGVCPSRLACGEDCGRCAHITLHFCHRVLSFRQRGRDAGLHLRPCHRPCDVKGRPRCHQGCPFLSHFLEISSLFARSHINPLASTLKLSGCNNTDFDCFV